MAILETVELAKLLIKCESVTPNDAGCQDIIRDELAPFGFKFTNLRFGNTSNLWCSRGVVGPHFVFAGHTDVVPPGDINFWTYPPFEPTISNGNLYGRGAADMKGGIAAMVIAVQRFITQYPEFAGTISFLLTSDEEGPGHDGTKRVLEKLQQDNVHIDWCIVGEPVSQKYLGDTIKLGSRGSLSAEIFFSGVQGHVGHAHRAVNPINILAPALAKIVAVKWDATSDYFPETSLQFTCISSDSGAENIIPDRLTCKFNVRFSPTTSVDTIKNKILEILDTQQSMPYKIQWRLNGLPYLSQAGQLTSITSDVVKSLCKQDPKICAVGGTSDARFIVPTMKCETLELGLMDTTMHAIDEHISCESLEQLAHVYMNILKRLFIK